MKLQTSSPGHINPLGGKCIHGKDGAKLYAGVLYNPSCAACQQMQEGKKK